jgi:hypothetical protein
MIKQVRPDLGAVECRVVDIDNDRNILRDGDVAEMTIVNSTTYGEMVAACEAVIVAIPGCETWF